MPKIKDKIQAENIVRIKDENLLERLNNLYDKSKNVMYTSKNNLFNDVIEKGLTVFEKMKEDSWALKHSRDTLLDAMHEHTKRMNYFIKFSKPFIKQCFADSEIILGLVMKICNYLSKDMSDYERKYYFDLETKSHFLPDDYKKEKQRLMDLYDYKVD